MEFTFTAASCNIRLDSPFEQFWSTRLAAYNSAFDQCDLTVSTRVVPELHLPEAMLCERVGDQYRYTDAEENTYLLRCAPSGKPMLMRKISSDGTCAEFLLSEQAAHGKYTLNEWEYSYMGMQFAQRMLQMGNAVLHGSAIRYHGKGVVFSADSGTGKSTHVGLWKKLFPNEVEQINDDKPAILPTENGYTVCGTPWSGKTDLNHNIAAPLTDIVFLKQGKENGIVRLSSVQAAVLLSRQIQKPLFDRAIASTAVSFAAKLAGAVRVWELTCDISDTAVYTVLEKIDG